jgi:hypothetical protein
VRARGLRNGVLLIEAIWLALTIANGLKAPALHS